MDPLTLEWHSMPVIDGRFLLLCRLESINAVWEGGGRRVMDGGEERRGQGLIKKLNKITAASTQAKYCASVLVTQQPIWKHTKLKTAVKMLISINATMLFCKFIWGSLFSSEDARMSPICTQVCMSHVESWCARVCVCACARVHDTAAFRWLLWFTWGIIKLPPCHHS